MPESVKALMDRIRTRSADLNVGILGLGYVGLPLAELFVRAGFHVLGFDPSDQARAVADAFFAGAKLRAEDVLASDEARLHPKQGYESIEGFDHLELCNAIIICVPTPLGKNREPDLSYVRSAAETIAANFPPDETLVVLESTTYPGTTKEMHELIRSKLQPHHGWLHMAYSPERVDPGRGGSLANVPKVVGGIDPVSTQVASFLYKQAFEQVIKVSSAEIAEASKLLENIYRSVNIAMVNELKCVFRDMGIDIWEVIEAAKTKPYGYQAFYPSAGVGGHCIPLDPFYLSWKAKEVGWPCRFIELAGEINQSMPDYVVQRTMLGLNQAGIAMKGSRILVLGAAYKPNVDDLRESPALKIIDKLRGLGVNVWYDDPFVGQLPDGTRSWRSHQLTDKDAPDMGAFDCVIIATAHEAFDWRVIGRDAKRIVDTCGVVKGPNVLRA